MEDGAVLGVHLELVWTSALGLRLKAELLGLVTVLLNSSGTTELLPGFCHAAGLPVP